MYILNSDQLTIPAVGEGVEANGGTGGKTVVRENKVAPIIIKKCKEEFQHITDFKEPLIYGRIADGMPEHALIQVSVEENKFCEQACLMP